METGEGQGTAVINLAPHAFPLSLPTHLSHSPFHLNRRSSCFCEGAASAGTVACLAAAPLARRPAAGRGAAARGRMKWRPMGCVG